MTLSIILVLTCAIFRMLFNKHLKCAHHEDECWKYEDEGKMSLASRDSGLWERDKFELQTQHWEKLPSGLHLKIQVYYMTFLRLLLVLAITATAATTCAWHNRHTYRSKREECVEKEYGLWIVESKKTTGFEYSFLHSVTGLTWFNLLKIHFLI